MNSITFFIIFVCILAIIFLTINLLLAPHNPYQEKISSFECGFHSFLGQNRSEFNISFFVFALLFLIFDLEIFLLYPYAVSSYVNNIYGLIIFLIFSLVLTLGFVFEIGKGALAISSRQNRTIKKSSSIYISSFNALEVQQSQINDNGGSNKFDSQSKFHP
jgi:NADH-ubiquinone oxidoreductase chain 3